MIVGRGAIAQAIPDRHDRLYFASGVASSLETREAQFQREINLLLEQQNHLRLVYFSSLCIFTQHSLYAEHKRQMERLVRESFPKWTIVRLGNIDWATNPDQLIPFIKNCLVNRINLRIADEYRHLLDRDEFLYWLGIIPDFNCEMNIPGERLMVAEIVGRYQSSWRALA